MNILYEDTALVVLDKPAGLTSEEGVPAALRQRWGKPDAYVGVIHRLDTGVSGLMVYARTPGAAAALTKQVTEYAHAHGVVVEAELGKLAGVEDDIKVDARSATFTDPEEAAEFVERTGVDSLAIAIGTSHGAYKFKGEPYLDFERLQEIHRLIPDTPLVLHGASTVLPEFVARCNEYGGEIPGAQGVPEEMIRTATQYGVCKVNIDTDLRLAMTAEIRRYLKEHPADFDPRKYLGPARDAIRKMVSHKITDVLGWRK